MSDTYKKASKFLSYVLRHRPDEIGLILDANGWADVGDLVAKSRAAAVDLTPSLIEQLVRSSDKQRFALSSDGKRIRANQGHSIDVDLALDPQQPPERLYHGTADRFLYFIRQEGLKPMSRQHVHLSPDEQTATAVGQRHGKPVVLVVEAGMMSRAGEIFFKSENGVWLVKRVEARFIRFPA